MTSTQQPTFLTKYKPYFIDDFCVDDVLKSTLRTLLEIDDLNILFIGNTSSGKTSLLYALIREYYGLRKNQSLPENNLLFINNIKEQGINYYRTEMKTFCQSHSSIYGKKKMIIVDDIDLINEQSQQVFRNYIDKYKHNVHFLSVCTNIQKVIESIQSRIHIVRITPPSVNQVRGIMTTILEQEGIQLTEEAQEYLLRFSGHSIRSLMNHLEKIYIVSHGAGAVDLAYCKQLCSNISYQQFEDYVGAVRSGDISRAIAILYSIFDYGYSVIDILDYFFAFVKSTDVLSEGEKYAIIPILCKYITIFHNVHEDSIELAIFTKDVAKDVFKRST